MFGIEAAKWEMWSLRGSWGVPSSLKLYHSVHTSLCPLQGPQGKQGMLGLPGIDGPTVSKHRNTNIT